VQDPNDKISWYAQDAVSKRPEVFHGEWRTRQRNRRSRSSCWDDCEKPAFSSCCF